MKRILVAVLAAVLVLPIAVMAEEATVASDAAAQANKTFNVYTDRRSPDNHYIPSGWIGDYGDLRLNDQCAENPHSGTTSLEFTYSAKRTQNQGWAGVYWQNPPNNWGNKKGGFDLTGMTKLTFWARGKKGKEIVQKFMVGGISGTYPDTASAEIGPVELSDTWQQYTINLAGKDLSYLNGGFGWTTTADLNPDGAVFYVDDIRFEADTAMQPDVKKAQAMPFYIYADRSSMVNHFIPSGWLGDYGDMKYNGACKEDPYLGDSCIKIIYNGKGAQGARWAGIYWQNPANNWGTVDAGVDLSKANQLTFWARGEKGGERIEEFKVGGIMGEFSDSDTAGIGPVILNKEWTLYAIDLKGKDLSYVIGGFCWATNADVNPDGATFYLDEIRYE
jgi:hypothetical protein